MATHTLVFRDGRIEPGTKDNRKDAAVVLLVDDQGMHDRYDFKKLDAALEQYLSANGWPPRREG